MERGTGKKILRHKQTDRRRETDTDTETDSNTYRVRHRNIMTAKETDIEKLNTETVGERYRVTHRVRHKPRARDKERELVNNSVAEIFTGKMQTVDVLNKQFLSKLSSDAAMKDLLFKAYKEFHSSAEQQLIPSGSTRNWKMCILVPVLPASNITP